MLIKLSHKQSCTHWTMVSASRLHTERPERPRAGSLRRWCDLSGLNGASMKHRSGEASRLREELGQEAWWTWRLERHQGPRTLGTGSGGAEEAGLSRRDCPAQCTVERVKDFNSYPKAKGQLQRDSSRRHGVVMLCVLSTVTRAQRFIRNYGIAEARETPQWEAPR